MFQQFFTDTLMGRFIKNLLSKELIPLLDFVKEGDTILQGCYYIFNNQVIKCNRTGILRVTEYKPLYPSNDLYPSHTLYPSGNLLPSNDIHPGNGLYPGDTLFPVGTSVSDEIIITHNPSDRTYPGDTLYPFGELASYNINMTSIEETAVTSSYTSEVTYLYPGDSLYPTDGLIINKTNPVEIPTIPSDPTYNTPFPDNFLYPSDTLYPGSIIANKITNNAEFTVLSIYNPVESTRHTYKYHSNTHYYDSETHKYLGEYLRYIRDYYNLDLMPYYNCYNNGTVDNLYLQNPTTSEGSYVIGQSSDVKVLSIPIKFGKTYTIALDCPTEVLCRSVIYGPAGLVRLSLKDKTYFSDHLASSYKRIPSCTFNHPFTYSVDTNDAAMYKMQKNLYLLIQVPSTNNSSIVVLEGDYTSLKTIECNEKDIRQFKLHSLLSLLQFNTGESYAFSDRLIEYLLLNVVNRIDTLTENITKTQKIISKVNDSYRKLLDNRKAMLGVWDTNINNYILKLIDEYSDQIYLTDMDGNLNRDVEELLLHKEGVRIDGNSVR